MIYNTLLLLIAVVAVYVLAQTVLRPLYYILNIKWRHGDKIYIYYFPLLGIASMIGFAKHLKLKNPLQLITSSLDKYPNAKALASAGYSHNELYFIDPELIKEVTVQQYQNFKKIDQVLFSNHFLEKGLLLNNGEGWKKSRNVLAHGFNFSNLRDKCAIVQRITQKTLQIFRLERQNTQNQAKSQPVNICTLVMRITGQVIFESFFGDSQQLEDAEIYSMKLADIVTRVGELALKESNIAKLRIFGDFYWEKEWLLSNEQKQLKQDILQFKLQMAQLVEKAISIGECKGLLALLTKGGENSFDREEIVQHFITLFFAGMDTTGITTGLCFYALAKYPEVLARVEKEIADLQLNRDETESINLEVLQKMDYTNALLKEVLRLWNPVQFLIARETIKTCRIGEFIVPAGTYISCFNFINNVNKKYFKNPTQFDPDRWLDSKQVEKIPTFANIPFSAGPRNCIGQHLAVLEAKMIIILVLKHYIPLINKSIDLKFKHTLLMIPIDDKLVYLEDRLAI